MKKILLGTTALFGAVALFAGAASAENPKVTVGGFADFQAGWVDQDNDDAQRDYGFRNDTEVTVHVDGKTDAGLGYGAVIDLEADVSEDADNQGLNASRTYVYMDGTWGRLQLGSAEGAEYTLKIDASNIARATGGIDGDWHYFANNIGQGVNFISTPRLVAAIGNASDAGDESTINANKITYYSPRFAGFQLGGSYTPDLGDKGQRVDRLDNTAQGSDVFSAGVNYEAQFNEVSLGLAATGEWGDDDSAAESEIRTWTAGGQVGFAGFSVAGSYGSYEKGLFTDDAEFWTAGAAYDFGPFGVSGTYLNSEADAIGGGDNEFENLVIGADYKLAEGLTPYVEVSLFDFDSAAGLPDNDGTVVLVGTELAF